MAIRTQRIHLAKNFFNRRTRVGTTLYAKYIGNARLKASSQVAHTYDDKEQYQLRVINIQKKTWRASEDLDRAPAVLRMEDRARDGI